MGVGVTVMCLLVLKIPDAFLKCPDGINNVSVIMIIPDFVLLNWLMHLFQIIYLIPIYNLCLFDPLDNLRK